MAGIVDVNTLFGPLPASSTELTSEALLGLMRNHQVSQACTLSTFGILLDATVGNSNTKATCHEQAELVPVATLNPTLYFGGRDGLLKLKNDGFALVRFFPGIQGWPIQYAPFRDLLKALDELQLPTMVDITHVGHITALETIMAAYPAPVILAHVDNTTLAEAIAALRQHPNWHLETSRLLGAGSLKLLADSVSAERILFGTGAPASPIASSLNALQYAGLDADAQQQILSGNARRVLNLA